MEKKITRVFQHAEGWGWVDGEAPANLTDTYHGSKTSALRAAAADGYTHYAMGWDSKTVAIPKKIREETGTERSIRECILSAVEA